MSAFTNAYKQSPIMPVQYPNGRWGMPFINEDGVNAKRAIMAEISLKGLGGFNKKLSSLLENRILGFNNINQSWTQR